jgi:hypothetical protein
MASPASDQYYLEGATQAPSPGNYQWIEPISIDDDDLTFGGKPLCTWYEEERQRLSSASDEEERRGRQRHRTYYTSSHHQSSKTKQSNKS